MKTVYENKARRKSSDGQCVTIEAWPEFYRVVTRTNGVVNIDKYETLNDALQAAGAFLRTTPR